MCFKGFLGRKHSRNFSGSSRKLSGAKWSCFRVSITVWRSSSCLEKLLFTHFLGLKHQGSILQSSRIDPWGVEATRINPRTFKDWSLDFQKLKIARFSHWNILYTTKAWYKHPFFLCIIIRTDFNMYICINNIILCWFDDPCLRNNNFWKRLS